MSEAQAGAGQQTPEGQAALAKPLTAIQLIERDLSEYIQRQEHAAKAAEQAIANVHAINGAIQSIQALLGKLRIEEQKAAAETKRLAAEVESAAKRAYAAVQPVATHAFDAVTEEIGKVENRVIDIASVAVKKDL